MQLVRTEKIEFYSKAGIIRVAVAKGDKAITFREIGALHFCSCSMHASSWSLSDLYPLCHNPSSGPASVQERERYAEQLCDEQFPICLVLSWSLVSTFSFGKL